MKSKTVDNYIYEGLGFPVELHNVELRYLDNEWCPLIDVQTVADGVLEQLAKQKARLTGAQVKFIRSYFSMPLKEFAEKVAHESPATVSLWEKQDGGPTNMNENTEHELRLYIIEQMYSKSCNPVKTFYEAFMETKQFFDESEPSAEITHTSQ